MNIDKYKNSHGMCHLSLSFTAAFEVILIQGRQTVKEVRSLSGQRLLSLRNYMDDVMTMSRLHQQTLKIVRKTVDKEQDEDKTMQVAQHLNPEGSQEL